MFILMFFFFWTSKKQIVGVGSGGVWGGSALVATVFVSKRSGRCGRMLPHTIYHLGNEIQPSSQNGKVARLNLPAEYWQHNIWSHDIKINACGSDEVEDVWHEPDQDQHSSCTLMTVKRGNWCGAEWWEGEVLFMLHQDESNTQMLNYTGNSLQED